MAAPAGGALKSSVAPVSTQGRHYALICQHFYPEMISTGMHMTELSVALVSLGLRITVLCDQPGIEHKQHESVPAHMVHEGIDIYRIQASGSHRGSVVQRGLRGLSFTWNAFRGLLRRRKELDGLIVTTNPPFLGAVAAILSKFWKLPYLLIVYDVYPDAPVRLGMLKPKSTLVWVWERVTRMLLRHATVVVAIGVDMAELIKAKMPASRHGRIVLIRNWSDDQLVEPISREDNAFAREHGLKDRFVVQYSGTIGRTHNVEPLIEAAKLLEGEPVTIQVIGDGAKKKSLQEMVQALGVSNVQFLPFQPLETLPQVLSAADLSVVCLGEEFTGVSVPSKAYGVMAAERPILALMARNSEIGQTVEQTGCGWVVEHATGEQVAQVVRLAMAYREDLVERGRRGRRAFLERFTLRKASRDYAEALALLEGPR